jgi:cytochrome c oxidase subunit 4
MTDDPCARQARQAMRERDSELRRETRQGILVWVALIMLALATVGSSYIPMGAWNSVANFVIALAKAALVAALFMKLRGSSPVLRLACATAIVIGSLLYGLSGLDYATRKPAATEPPAGPDPSWAAKAALSPGQVPQTKVRGVDPIPAR